MLFQYFLLIAGVVLITVRAFGIKVIAKRFDPGWAGLVLVILYFSNVLGV